MAPSVYDPQSPDEQVVPLPSAPLRRLAPNVVLQPPLSRRGTGPGLVAFFPPPSALTPSTRTTKPLDPEPVFKCAEEGFVVVGITPSSEGWSIMESLSKAIDALLEVNELDTKDKFAVTVYYPDIVHQILEAIAKEKRVVCVVVYGGELPETFPSSVPTIWHLPITSPSSLACSIPNLTIYKIQESTSPYFVLPQTETYVPTAAALAHSRNIPFWRKHLGGPSFPLEEIWDEHAYFEFEIRSVARTMGTMVAEPYVNHVPTMTGGIGRKALTEFYRDHFIFANPPDTTLETISRTVGADRLVDEFIFHTTHTKMIDWLMPGVPPTGKRLSIPMLGVINIRGDRLYHEHIWWDQATVLLQAGILPSHVPFPLKDASLRLPVAGAESAYLLRDEMDGKSNEMMGWGLEREKK